MGGDLVAAAPVHPRRVAGDGGGRGGGPGARRVGRRGADLAVDAADAHQAGPPRRARRRRGAARSRRPTCGTRSPSWCRGGRWWTRTPTATPRRWSGWRRPRRRSWRRGRRSSSPSRCALLEMACETGATGDTVLRAVDQLVLEGRLVEALEVVDRAPRPSRGQRGDRGARGDAGIGAGAAVRAAGGPRAPRPAARPHRRRGRRADARHAGGVGVAAAAAGAHRPAGPARPAARAAPAPAARRRALVRGAQPPLPGRGAARPRRRGSTRRSTPSTTDLRVRREALRVLFKDPSVRTRAICTALADEDPRVKRLALAAAADGGCPEPAVPLVVAAGHRGRGFGAPRGGHPDAGLRGRRLALDALLRLTRMRRSILGNVKRVQRARVPRRAGRARPLHRRAAGARAARAGGRVEGPRDREGRGRRPQGSAMSDATRS